MRWIVIVFLSLGCVNWGLAAQGKRPFTVADEIGLTLFGFQGDVSGEPQFSPDGNYFAVWTVKGKLNANRLEEEIRFYHTADVKQFLQDEKALQPKPIWSITRANKEGSVLLGWHWLGDSSGIAFTRSDDNGNNRLFVADLSDKTVEPLTSETEKIQNFDIRDRQHYIYTVSVDVEVKAPNQSEQEEVAIRSTGDPFELYKLIFPDDPRLKQRLTDTQFWAVVDGKRFEVKHNGLPVMPSGWSLSPDGKTLVTRQPVTDVPSLWEASYLPPPYSLSQARIHAGHYDARSSPVHRYVLMDLQTGEMRPLTEGPFGEDAGWLAGGVVSDPDWSADGKEVLLPNAFLKAKQGEPSRPCLAVVEVSSRASSCVEEVKGHTTETSVEDGYRKIWAARFAARNGSRVMVAYQIYGESFFRTTEYRRSDNGQWQLVRDFSGLFKNEFNSLEINIRQSLKDPPVLVASNQTVSRVVWDPNPQLQDIMPVNASIYTWKDQEGQSYRGGLYKPNDYKPGRRYPLVIQTHGFDETRFWPSGGLPTGTAAWAMAASGIIVLQTGSVGNCSTLTVDEGPCVASGYERVANQLVQEGMVDPERIGIIGFSRSCFAVMEMLTRGSFHVKAASITDGIMFDYFQYILAPDARSYEMDAVIGAPPFGEGLTEWLKRSPGFNLDKVSTPLLINALGRMDVPGMWLPYAVLHHLKKPVDLIILNTNEHIITNPAIRLVSQGGAADWFRFWLKDEEDSDPSKAQQYVHWRELRKLEQSNRQKLGVPEGASN